EEIMKMKAGGVNVIPTYVFWSFHEEKEGQWDWTGNKDLRRFVELCKKHDMPVIIRIGSFCHGEVRNGAIPDWVLAKPIDIRSNDPLWLEYTQKVYNQIGKQLKGLFYKDGGPIIATQIENEHQHSAAPWAINYPKEPNDYTTSTYDSGFAKIGVSVQDDAIPTEELGNIHMKTLKDMAVKEGFVTPFYTVTGWGNAAVIGNEAIPVTSAYPINFWSEPVMSDLMLFTDLHKKPDYSPVRYNPEDFPSFAAEMGVGMQPIYARRPIPTVNDAEALMLRTLGSGANCIGYYMYHGGSTPKMPGGTGFYADEPMGIPKISYDYLAPLGEFGLEYESYRPLRLIHSFLADFGDRLAPMEVVLPENAKTMTPDNRDDLRYVARMRDGKGFLFLLNYQDHDTMRHDMSDISVNIDLGEERVRIPAKGMFTLPKNACAILPFNFDMDGAMLKYATAQPLMKIDDNGTPHYFFFSVDGIAPEFVINDKTYRPTPGFASTFSVKGQNGSGKVTTQTKEQALTASTVNGKLLITKASTLPSGEDVVLLQEGNNIFEYIVYPSKVGFKPQTTNVESVKPDMTWEMRNPRRMTVNFDPTKEVPQVNEWFLEIDYDGDVAMAFLDNEIVLDHFWYGQPWRIGLKRFPKMKDKEV
ncbi:MAG: beta-galactosidase, partial [Bacteroidaceae bacterium]|nr:beta-galactosidase [Bacteroidaceae bacterium]